MNLLNKRQVNLTALIVSSLEDITITALFYSYRVMDLFIMVGNLC